MHLAWVFVFINSFYPTFYRIFQTLGILLVINDYLLDVQVLPRVQMYAKTGCNVCFCPVQNV